MTECDDNNDYGPIGRGPHLSAISHSTGTRPAPSPAEGISSVDPVSRGPCRDGLAGERRTHRPDSDRNRESRSALSSDPTLTDWLGQPISGASGQGGPMNPFRSNPRRRRKTEFGPELLESRELLTGGRQHLRDHPRDDRPSRTGRPRSSSRSTRRTSRCPRRAITLGIDVVADSGSTVKPLIASVDDPHGNIVPQTFHSIYDPHLTHLAGGQRDGHQRRAVAAEALPARPDQAGDLHRQRPGRGQDQRRLPARLLPARRRQRRRHREQDRPPDRQERAGRPRRPARSTTSTPTPTATAGSARSTWPSPSRTWGSRRTSRRSSRPTTTRRTTSAGRRPGRPPSNTAHFTGTATPGATITYTETANKVPATTTTADATGNYSIIVPLATGTNTFKVVSTDAFGQTISGTLAPVTYMSTPQKPTDGVVTIRRRDCSTASTPHPHPPGGRGGVAVIDGSRDSSATPRVECRRGRRADRGIGVVAVAFEGASASSVAIRPRAHAAAPRTTGSGSSSRPISAGTAAAAAAPRPPGRARRCGAGPAAWPAPAPSPSATGGTRRVARQPGDQVGVGPLGPRLELGRPARGRLAVPGADVLADVAAEGPVVEPVGERRRRSAPCARWSSS